MRDLTIYRLDSAKDCIESADMLLTAGLYRGSINRSYYAIFHSMRAVLAEDDVSFKKHSAVISYFRREYIKTGVFDAKFSNYVGDSFDTRNNCDYSDFITASREEAETQYNHAVEFYNAIKNYLEGIVIEKNPNRDTLQSIGVVASRVYSGETPTTIFGDDS